MATRIVPWIMLKFGRTGNLFPLGPEKKGWFEHRAITLMLSKTFFMPLPVVVCLAFWCQKAVDGVVSKLCSWWTQSPSVLLLLFMSLSLCTLFGDDPILGIVMLD